MYVGFLARLYMYTHTLVDIIIKTEHREVLFF